jgi:catechol 2,3-dioxygenase-like lactoylglutathione lyase family enzyme
VKALVVLAPHHLALRVHDLERVERWYREVLGLAVLKRWPGENGKDRSVWLQLGGGAFLAIERTAEPEVLDRTPQESGWSLLALRIDAVDREPWIKRLESQGVSITGSTPWTLYFEDPEGNRVGLSHHPETYPGGSKAASPG